MFSSLSIFIISASLITQIEVEARLRNILDSRSDRAELEYESITSCHWREFDLCSVGLASFFQNQNGLPQNEPEMKRQCELFTESARCFEDYSTKCFSEPQLGLFDMFSSSSMEVLRDFCEPESELRKNYTKHVKCYREIQRQHQRSCVTDLQVGFEFIQKKNLTSRLEIACCNTNRFKECIYQPMEYECGSAAVETISELIESLAGSFLSLTCRQYDPFGEKCKSILPAIGTKPHGSRSTSAISKLVSSFVNVPAQT